MRPLLLGFLLLTCAFAVWSRMPVLTIYVEDYPPYNYLDETGRVVGINVDLIQQALKHQNIAHEMVLLPWSRAYRNALQTPLGGVMTTARLKERESQFRWVGPLFSGKARLYRLSRRPEIVVSELSALQRYIVGVKREDVYITLLQRQGLHLGKQLVLFSSDNDMYPAFVRGRLDLIVASSLRLPYILPKMGLTAAELTPLLAVEGVVAATEQGNYLALNPQVPSHWVTNLNQQLRALCEAGEFARVLRRYGIRADDIGPGVRCHKLE